jgi:peptidoglycan/LPS O-acetylase OafA/YrhL
MADTRPAHGGEFLPAIALVRAVAAPMVVYDHLVGMWLEQHGRSWRPALWMQRWVFDPFHLMMHGGGLAVAMFFVISGFVIVYVAQRESRREFATRRVFRIFPPLWTSMLLLVAAYVVTSLSGHGAWAETLGLQRIFSQANPWPDTLAAMTLANYLLGTPAINGVAWTLTIEVLFYSCVLLLLPLLKSRPRVALALAWTGLAALQYVAHASAFVFLLAVNGVYVTFLFLGTLIYLRWSGRVGNLFSRRARLRSGRFSCAGSSTSSCSRLTTSPTTACRMVSRGSWSARSWR